MTIEFVPPRVPLVDLNTGMITREWYLLLRGLFNNGGIDNADVDKVGPIGGMDEALAAFSMLETAAGSSPGTAPVRIDVDNVAPAFSGLADEIALLSPSIDDLRKGIPVL